MAEIHKALEKDILAVKAEKTNSEPGDGHQDGDKCLIIAESPDTPYGIIYLVIFEDFPLPVAVVDFRIKFITDEERIKIKLTTDQREYLAQFPPKLFKFYNNEPRQKKQKKAQNRKKN